MMVTTSLDENGKPRLRIVNESGVGFKTKLYIDDVDVSECFDGVDISIPLRGGVEATLHATISQSDVQAGLTSTHLELREGARELLVHAGWTPPPAE